MTYSLSGIPARRVALGQAGVDRIIKFLQQQPQLLSRAIDALSRDPRKAIEHMFRLSHSQRVALQSISNESLHAMLRPVLEARASLAGRRVVQARGPAASLSVRLGRG